MLLVSLLAFSAITNAMLCDGEQRGSVKNARCYTPDTALGKQLPQAYAKQKAIVRVIGDGRFCPGFLIGSEGHVLTDPSVFAIPRQVFCLSE